MNRPKYKELYLNEKRKNYNNIEVLNKLIDFLKEHYEIDINLKNTDFQLEKCIVINDKKQNLYFVVGTNII